MNEERIDQLTKDLFSKAELEKPSIGFTDNVMAAVAAKKAATTSTPLISTKGWILVAASIAALLIFAYSVPSTGSSSTVANYPILDGTKDFLGHLAGNVGSLASGTSIPNFVWMVAASALIFLGLDQLLKRKWNVSVSLL